MPRTGHAKLICLSLELVVSLDLSSCFLNDADANRLACAIPNLRMLQVVDVTGNSITIEGANNMLKFVGVSTTVRRILFANNSLSLEDAPQTLARSIDVMQQRYEMGTDFMLNEIDFGSSILRIVLVHERLSAGDVEEEIEEIDDLEEELMSILGKFPRFKSFKESRPR